jgi:hypothetical protein
MQAADSCGFGTVEVRQYPRKSVVALYRRHEDPRGTCEDSPLLSSLEWVTPEKESVMANGYYSTRDLCVRYRCSSRTLFRRMKREENPFPAACMQQAGSFNLWDADEVAAWEQRERERTRLRAAPECDARAAA